MSQDALDTERIARLLIADAVTSLGEWAREEVLAVVANMKQMAQLWLEDGASLSNVRLGELASLGVRRLR